MTSDVFDGYRYDKTDTVSSCVIVKGSLLNYADLVRREGGKTQIQSTFVIDMDAVKDSLRITPTPSSMDVVFIISKISTYREKLYETKKKHSKYLFADLKFNVTSPAKVDKNISNDSIKEKIKLQKLNLMKPMGRLKPLNKRQRLLKLNKI